MCGCVWWGGDCTNTIRIHIVYTEIGAGAYIKCAFGMLAVGDVGRAVVAQD